MQGIIKRICALIFTLVMLMVFMNVLGLVENVHADETQETSIKVDVLTQEEENKLLKAFQDLAVSSESAEEYGFTEPDKVRDPDESGQISLDGKVTTLDVLVEVMKQIYGDAFTAETAQNYLKVNNSGTITKIFGETTTMSGFTINGKNPMYKGELAYGKVGSLIDDSIVDEGDSLRFFRTVDDDFGLGGLYSSMFFFENKDQATYNSVAGEALEVNVSVDYAFANMLEGMGGGPELDPQDAVVALLNEEGKVVAEADVDEEGTASLICTLPGEYSLVISEYDGNAYDEHFVTSYGKVSVSLPEEMEATVKVAVRNFVEANAFDILPQDLEVSSNAAEKYGEFRDIVAGNGGKVTLADVVFTMHASKFGDVFKEDTVDDYIGASETGYFSKCFGISTSFISYLINEDLSMTGGIFEIALDEGDRVDLYKYLDEVSYSDLYSCFDVETKEVDTDESFQLQLSGIGWSYTGPLKKSANKDVVAATYDEDGKLTPIDGATMDENGKVTLCFNDPGTYYVTASGYVNAPVADYSQLPDITYIDADVPIILPYCKVTVSATADYSVRHAIDSLGKITLDSEDAIKAAEEAYEALSDEEKAKVTNYEVLLKAKIALAELKLAAAQADIDDGSRPNQNETSMNVVYSTLGMFRPLDEGTFVTPKDDKTVTVTIQLNPSTSVSNFQKIALAKYGEEDSATIIAEQTDLKETGKNDSDKSLYTAKYTFDLPLSMVGQKMPYSIFYESENKWHKFSSQPYMIVLSAALYSNITEAETELTKAKDELTKAKSELAKYKEIEKVQMKKVTKVKVKAGKKKATISWKSLGKGYTYKVYQLNPKNGKYKAVKNVKNGKKCVVKKLKKGQKYFFKVQAQKKMYGKTVLTKESKVVKSKKIK